MQTQTIFQVGNSNAVTLPPTLLQDFGLKKGKKVVVSKSPDGEAIMIVPAKKVSQKTNSTSTSDAEFQKWLKIFMAENGEILDELATR